MADPQDQSVTVNDYLALELGRKELANVVLRAQLEAANAQLEAANARIRALEADAVEIVDEPVPAVT